MDARTDIQLQSTFVPVVLSSAVADGAGGLWAVASTASRDSTYEDSLLGYARLFDGRWTLWRIPGDESEVPVDGFEVKRASLPALLESLASDGRGGVYGLWGGVLFQVDQDGELKQLGTTSANSEDASHLEGTIAVDPASGNIVVFAKPSRGEADGWLTRIDSDGNILQVEPVSLPSWFAKAQFQPPLHEASLSLGPRATWISAGPWVFSVSGNAVIAYSSPAVHQQMEDDARAARRADVREGILRPGSLVLGASLLLGTGAFGASEINDERFLFTGGQVLGGAALSLLPAMALDAYSPARGWGIGTAGAMRFMFFSAGALTAPLLGAVGTWGMGELLHGSRSPGAAFGGAVAGAAVGTLLSIGVTLLLKDLPRELQPATLGLTLGFIGSGATLGYQALGGGPRTGPSVL
jgi:hypothetical protein